jgi:hypothetical protein
MLGIGIPALAYGFSRFMSWPRNAAHLQASEAICEGKDMRPLKNGLHVSPLRIGRSGTECAD